jgi:hypothetical protein
VTGQALHITYFTTAASTGHKGTGQALHIAYFTTAAHTGYKGTRQLHRTFHNSSIYRT